GRDLPVGNRDVHDGVHAVLRVDDVPALQQQAVARRRSLRPSALRLRLRLGGEQAEHAEDGSSGNAGHRVTSVQSGRERPFRSQTTWPPFTVSSHSSFCVPAILPPPLSTNPNSPE